MNACSSSAERSEFEAAWVCYLLTDLSILYIYSSINIYIYLLLLKIRYIGVTQQIDERYRRVVYADPPRKVEKKLSATAGVSTYSLRNWTRLNLRMCNDSSCSHHARRSVRSQGMVGIAYKCHEYLPAVGCSSMMILQSRNHVQLITCEVIRYRIYPYISHITT